jgi:hypothetical protein
MITKERTTGSTTEEQPPAGFDVPSPELVHQGGELGLVKETIEALFEGDLTALMMVLERDLRAIGKEPEKALNQRHGFGLLTEDVRGSCLTGIPRNENPEALRAFAGKLGHKWNRLRQTHEELGLPDLQVLFRLVSELAEVLPEDWPEKYGHLAWLPEDDQGETEPLPIPPGAEKGPYKDRFARPWKYYFFEVDQAYKHHGWNRVPPAVSRLCMKTRPV